MAFVCRRLQATSLALTGARVTPLRYLSLARTNRWHALQQPSRVRRGVSATATKWGQPDGFGSSGQQSITDSSSCTFVNLADSFAKFIDHWSPKIVGEVNGMHVKVVKLEGEFDWQYAVLSTKRAVFGANPRIGLTCSLLRLQPP